MNKNYMDVTFVIDRSGSMNSLVDDTIGGFNATLQEQQRIPGDVRITLVQFDHEYEFVHRATPAKAVAPLTKETYVPRGNTALLDAMGRAISEAGERFRKMPEDQRPGAVVFVLITDGHENASREFTRERIKEMVEHQQSKYGWTFVFLGANMDAIAEGGSLGVLRTCSANYAGTPDGVRGMYAAVGKGLSASFAACSAGEPLKAFFDPADVVRMVEPTPLGTSAPTLTSPTVNVR